MPGGDGGNLLGYNSLVFEKQAHHDNTGKRRESGCFGGQVSRLDFVTQHRRDRWRRACLLTQNVYVSKERFQSSLLQLHAKFSLRLLKQKQLDAYCSVSPTAAYRMVRWPASSSVLRTGRRYRRQTKICDRSQDTLLVMTNACSKTVCQEAVTVYVLARSTLSPPPVLRASLPHNPQYLFLHSNVNVCNPPSQAGASA